MVISPECLKAMLIQGYGRRSIDSSRDVPGWVAGLMNNFFWSCNYKAFFVPEDKIAKALAKTYQHLIDNGEEVVLKELGRVSPKLILKHINKCYVRPYYSNYKISRLT